ncbi:MAG: 1-deoxy-D-xylulose-5-phosphate reductoisomerase [Verrucomicrobia bacterium TMED44]|nr:MAG: 1-deoxy-D-xylulose-5-phosphate reductoisomerase [Verrucomicrobia bacterium TMED44]
MVLLGATGSIGTSTLQVLRKHPDRLQLIGISANSNSQKLTEIVREFRVPYAYLPESAGFVEGIPAETTLDRSRDGLVHLASLAEADLVVVAIVGSSGLSPTLAALEAGKDIVLANKESLVLGGDLVMKTAQSNQARVLPADSEHNAIFQCIQGEDKRDLDSIILTASGGSFRDTPVEQLKDVTVKQALNHPNWSMGNKVTIDSATMANKGLELIEARWLFDLPPSKLEVVIHPTSVVHAMVRFVDGCCLAQLSPPSMTFALQHALLYPERAPGVHPSLDFSKPLDLHFSPPSLERFPCLRLAQESLTQGGSAPLVFNAANELAVDAFLLNRIGFLEISDIIYQTLSQFDHQPKNDLSTLLSLDSEARRIASVLIGPST